MSKSSPTSVKLVISGVGHIPTFKNGKRVRVDWENAKVHQFTRKDIASTMDAIIQSIASQLYSASPTNEYGMATVPLLRSWIVSSLPLDDCTKWVRHESFDVQDVAPGEEGADIIIEKI